MKKMFSSLMALVLLMTTMFTLPFSSEAATTLDKYLMVYFLSNSFEEQQVCFAVSDDGLQWTQLNDSYPILKN